jgi:hypothetical protein
MLPQALLPFVVLIVFAGFVGLAMALGLRQQRKAREQLGALAAQLGLELRRQPARFGFEPTPTVEGRHRNRSVRFFSYTTGSGKSRTTWCAVSAAIGGTGAFSLDLYPENFLVRLVTALGMQDIRIGDPPFDQAFIIKSNDPAYAMAALLPEIRARLLDERHRGAFGGLTVKDHEVRYAEMGGFDQPDQTARLGRILEIVCNLGEVAEVYQA